VGDLWGKEATMKLRSDGVRLCVVGLTLTALAMATPMWASVPPASQSENAHGEDVCGISLVPWLGVLWDSLREVVAREVPSDKDAHVPTLTVPAGQEQLLASEPSDSDTTESAPEINPDG
jgi:hypothetical protein